MITGEPTRAMITLAYKNHSTCLTKRHDSELSSRRRNHDNIKQRLSSSVGWVLYYDTKAAPVFARAGRFVHVNQDWNPYQIVQVFGVYILKKSILAVQIVCMVAKSGKTTPCRKIGQY